MKYTLGIDFGGGASKATLLSDEGKIISTNTVEYSTFYPQAGYAEQNPVDWYNATVENIKSILWKTKISPNDIVAVSLDAATHTAVLCDVDFSVVRNSIYWTDTRCTKEVQYLKDSYNQLIVDKVMHNPDTIWTLPQLMWIRDNEPDIWKQTKRIMFAKDYVRHLFTGDYVTDNIEAEGSMLFDYNTQSWSQELCDILGIDISMLPHVVSPDDIAGYVNAKSASDTGLIEGTPLLCGTTDTVMEVFASGAVEDGQMTLKLATAGRICVVTDKAYPDKNLINYSHVIDGKWYPGTATKSCAASYRWYRDTFGGDYAEMDKGAAEISPGCEGLIFSPYLNGELTPYADPQLCASFIGVRSSHTKAHFTRAVLEGVAFSMLDCMNELESIGVPHTDKAIIIGGGGKSPLWRQIVSDVLGITLIEKMHADSSFGSAMMAGVKIGFWENAVEAVNICNKTLSETKPDMDKHKAYQRYFKRYKKVHDALAAIYHEE